MCYRFNVLSCRECPPEQKTQLDALPTGLSCFASWALSPAFGVPGPEGSGWARGEWLILETCRPPWKTVDIDHQLETIAAQCETIAN